MLLSKACEYGFRAVLHLASLQPDGYVSISTISKELNISFAFLTKVFQQLTQAGLMTSHRGPNGGVALARPASEISLLDIYTAIDGPKLFYGCMLGLPNCGDAAPCPLHDQWSQERGRLHQLFASTDLEALANDMERFNFRLKTASE